MYTNDERFAILHTPGSNTWTLQIKFVQRRDHGMYECQVSITIFFIVLLKRIGPYHIHNLYDVLCVFTLIPFRLAILLLFHFFPQIDFVCVTF